ncbi:hypothetical protein MKX08_001545 [Trichoderma sp. CBMAI-0020]|nr:hypothetical protein MKX08_001545 [Trichoderma sp. CBMAI-0020]
MASEEEKLGDVDVRRKGEVGGRLDKKAAAGEGAKAKYKRQGQSREKAGAGAGAKQKVGERRQVQRALRELRQMARDCRRKEEERRNEENSASTRDSKENIDGNPPRVIHSVKHATTTLIIKSNHIVPSHSSSQAGPVCVVLRAPQVSESPSAIVCRASRRIGTASDEPPSAGGPQSSRGTHPHTPAILYALPVACRQEFSSLDRQQSPRRTLLLLAHGLA